MTRVTKKARPSNEDGPIASARARRAWAFPRRDARFVRQKGILTPGSSYSPRPSHPGLRAEEVAILAAFVPGHSGGAVPDLHRLPWMQRRQSNGAFRRRQGFSA